MVRVRRNIVDQHSVHHPFARRRIFAQPHQTVAQTAFRGAVGVGHIDIAILRELRVERQPQQPRLSGFVHVERHPRLGEQLAILDHADATGPLVDEDAAVRREGDRPRRVKPRSEDLDIRDGSKIGRLHAFRRGRHCRCSDGPGCCDRSRRSNHRSCRGRARHDGWGDWGRGGRDATRRCQHGGDGWRYDSRRGRLRRRRVRGGGQGGSCRRRGRRSGGRRDSRRRDGLRRRRRATRGEDQDSQPQQRKPDRKKPLHVKPLRMRIGRNARPAGAGLLRRSIIRDRGSRCCV